MEVLYDYQESILEQYHLLYDWEQPLRMFLHLHAMAEAKKAKIR